MLNHIRKRFYGAGVGDFFGGLSATLVALPSAIAFGLMIYSPLGSGTAAIGAMAGILGTIALALVAPFFGGSKNLITAPCAPAAAVLAAFTTELTANALQPVPSTVIPLLVISVTAMAGLIQWLIGRLGGGLLIKYVPFPVVTGYLSGVGLIIIFSQIGKFLGLTGKLTLHNAQELIPQFNGFAVTVGCVSIVAMLLSPRVTRKIPAPIVALGAGLIAYFALGSTRPEMLSLSGNPLLIGPIQAGGGLLSAQALTSGAPAFLAQWSHYLWIVLVPSLMLAGLLSIDTLKTCLVVDALTSNRHDSNRELRGQGLGNLAAALVGGMPGAGTMGATLISLTSGGQSPLSAVLVGVMSLLALLAVGPLMAWVPHSALAGILLVVGFRMIDLKTFRSLRNKESYLDFFVVLGVVLTALFSNLMAAAGVGIVLAVFLFIRDQIRESVIRRQHLGNKVFSKKRRLPEEVQALEKHGDQVAIFELQGNLFFGTTDQLYTHIEPHFKQRRIIILDMKRVRSFDFSGVHMLEQIAHQIHKSGGQLIFTDLPLSLKSGVQLIKYFDDLGLDLDKLHIKVFTDLDSGLEWAEEQVLDHLDGAFERREYFAELREISLFKDLADEELKQLSSVLTNKTLNAGELLFRAGDEGSELFIVKRGLIKIYLPLSNGKRHLVTSIGPGDFLGDMSFLDHAPRSADAEAALISELVVVHRDAIDRLCAKWPSIGRLIFTNMSLALAQRLRITDAELRELESS